jgi:hypothetical protein
MTRSSDGEARPQESADAVAASALTDTFPPAPARLHMADRKAEIHPAVMQAIGRAIASSAAVGRKWHVCLRTEEHTELVRFSLGSYRDIERLAKEIRGLGYELTLLHPEHTDCDFLLEPGHGERGEAPDASAPG